MPTRRRIHTHARGWTSAFVAALLHGGIALALPHETSPAPRADRPELVWLHAPRPTAGEGGNGAGEAVAGQTTSRATAESPTRQKARIQAPANDLAKQSKHHPKKRTIRRAKRPFSNRLEAASQPLHETPETKPDPHQNIFETLAEGFDEALRTASLNGEAAAGHGGSAAQGEPGRRFGGLGHGGTNGKQRAIGRAPNLLATGSPCRGYFPLEATTNHGEVRLLVRVDSEGHAHATRVLAERPRRQGFARAARACAPHLRFAPAVDTHGAPIAARTKLQMRFNRL